MLFILSHNIKYKSWKRRIHFGTLVPKCLEVVVKFWAPTFLKWNLRQNISKSHLPRASQLPCLWSFSKMYGQSLRVFSRHWKFMSKPWLQKQNGKRYIYIYIETWKVIQEIRIHLRQPFFFCSWQCTWAYRTAGSTWKGRSREIRKQVSKIVAICIDTCGFFISSMDVS